MNHASTPERRRAPHAPLTLLSQEVKGCPSQSKVSFFTIFYLITEHSVVGHCNFRIINITSAQRPDKPLGFQHAIGFAAGFAGGKNHGLKDIMLKVFVGVVTGLALRAASGRAKRGRHPQESLGSALQKAVQPDPPNPDANVPGLSSSAELTALRAPVQALRGPRPGPARSIGPTRSTT
jgi:hypothetical protein